MDEEVDPVIVALFTCRDAVPVTKTPYGLFPTPALFATEIDPIFPVIVSAAVPSARIAPEEVKFPVMGTIFPLTERAPLLTITANAAILAFAAVTFPFNVLFPPLLKKSAVAVLVVDEVTFEEIVNPAFAVNPPPAAAEVPPPTNDAVIAAFVSRATLTFWSMVTVKLLE